MTRPLPCATLPPTTPIVVLTGLEDYHTGIEAIRLGVQDYLNKASLDGDVLARTVRHALERHRLVTEQELLIEDLDAFSHTVANDRKNPLLAELGAQLKVPPSWPVALGYAPWIEEVWVNYLSNAIKYGGSPPVIRLGSEADSNGRIRF